MFHLYEKMAAGGVYTIAEMSANHAGKLENALKLVHTAHDMGADCLKIQTYTADTITLDCDTDDFMIHGGLWDGQRLYDLYRSAYTPWDWQPRIKEECEKVGIDFLSTPFDPTAVDFLDDMGCEAYKIASFELVDIPLIEYAAAKGKPMIISCGMGSQEEIQEAVDACRRMHNDQIVLLKCCSEYPTEPKNMHLCMISDMARRFGVPVGLSDHSMGHMADVLAVAQGARVIEKHFCLSRQLKNPDSDFSMEPAEFAEMVKQVGLAASMLGSVHYGPSPAEEEEFKCRRSLFVVKDIAPGESITAENVRSVRPNSGLAPKYWKDVMGKRARRKLSYGSPLRWEDLE